MTANYFVVTDQDRKIPVTVTRFPSGEVNVKLEIAPGSQMPMKHGVQVLVQGYEPNTLFILACIKNALEDMFLRSNLRAEVTLVMPYVPNARYDRHMVDGDSFGLQVFASMLNGLKFDRVLVVDPHSAQTPALIKNCVQIPQHILMLDIFNMYKPDFDFLVAPDDGASKKIYKLAQAMNKPVIMMSKVRDPIDGKITGIKQLDQFPDTGSKNCLIVDDICDGGRTFIEAAKVLKANGAGDVSLAVSHGIFSQGINNLLDNGIEHVYSTDSFDEWTSQPGLSVYKYF